MTGVLRPVLSVGRPPPLRFRPERGLPIERKNGTAVPRHHCYQHHVGRDGADPNVHGAMMWLISDSEAAAFIAIVAVMAALALVVALG